MHNTQNPQHFFKIDGENELQRLNDFVLKREGKIQKGECGASKPTGDFVFTDLKEKKIVLRLVRFMVRDRALL